MKITYKESFKIRFNRQLLYIAQDSKSAATQFRDEIREKLSLLKKNPLIHRQSIYFNDPLIRDLIFKGYTLTYRINNETIEVFGFTKYQETISDKEEL